MRHGSLFSGIGGFDLAAQWMGWENVFQVEWDRWCQKILAKNFPDTLRFGDIKEFNDKLQNGEITTNNDREFWSKGREIKSREQPRYRKGVEGCVSESGQIFLRRINIITGGFPCQPFSHAGKRKGTDDSRYLWPEMLTTIRILKPSYVVGENVAGLVSMENGKTLDRILSDLANEGYTTEQFIIPACSIGAWHRRDRIWIVAYSINTNTKCGNKEQDRCSIGINKERPTTLQTQDERREGKTIQYNGLDDLSWDAPNTNIQGSQGYGRLRECRGQWTSWKGSESLEGIWQSEPAVGRVANGVSNRVDRLKGLGNAIVPQVAYQIFKAIGQYDTSL